jgi:hypothetical protein
VKTHPEATAIPHPGHLDAHRTNPGLRLALWQVVIPDYSLAPLGIVAVGILCSKHRNFCLYRLRQEPLRSLA